MKYLCVDCRMELSSPVKFNVNPLFLIRSILGNSLRRECCIDLKMKCNECENAESCVYNQFFEGIKSNYNSGLKVHPYSLHLLQDVAPYSALDHFDFRIVLYGKDCAVIYPYIYMAFILAGKKGILKDRIPFVFNVLRTGIGFSENTSIKNSIESWNENTNDYKPFSGFIKISLITPLRFQYNGHYGLDFTKREFFSCLVRRMTGMLSIYGDRKNNDFSLNSDSIEMQKESLHWVDLFHYSARQKTSMMLGGIMGDIILSGDFQPNVMMALDFADKFSLGKNVVFGLGNVDIWKREA